jgi:hypothetical protein
MKVKMTVDEALEFADEWMQGMSFYEGSQGWRVVCMVLASEVRQLREEKLVQTINSKVVFMLEELG